MHRNLNPWEINGPLKYQYLQKRREWRAIISLAGLHRHPFNAVIGPLHILAYRFYALANRNRGLQTVKPLNMGAKKPTARARQVS